MNLYYATLQTTIQWNSFLFLYCNCYVSCFQLKTISILRQFNIHWKLDHNDNGFEILNLWHNHHSDLEQHSHKIVCFSIFVNMFILRDNVLVYFLSASIFNLIILLANRIKCIDSRKILFFKFWDLGTVLSEHCIPVRYHTTGFSSRTAHWTDRSGTQCFFSTRAAIFLKEESKSDIYGHFV